VREIRIASFTELIERLYESSWREDLGRFRSAWAFRGVSDAASGLGTGLARLSERASEVESHLLRNFRKYAARDAVAIDNVWSWLALAQHHGLPTRLLDWSYSPWVALHFATAELDLFDRDGVVWCVDYARCRELLPRRLARLLAREGADVFTVELLARGATSLAELDRLARDEFVLFLEPPSIDDRIVNQSALFSLMKSAEGRLDRFLARHEELVRRLVIPAALKWEVRDKLDQAGIHERLLFPGLDGLTRYLRRYYTPRRRRGRAA
jgi:hypothetical protein